MSRTKIKVCGNMSPEYVALQGVAVGLKTLFARDPGRAAANLFESALIPDQQAPKDTFVPSIMSQVEDGAMDFYKLLGVLNELSPNANAVLTAIHDKFVGKGLLRMNHH